MASKKAAAAMVPAKTVYQDLPPYRDLIAFDFDGVLHEHRSYVAQLGRIDVTPLLAVQAQGYATAVVTANDVHRVANALRKKGLSVIPDPAMRHGEWFGGHNGNLVLVTNRKVSAKMYVDDRAIHWDFGSGMRLLWDEMDRREGYHPCPVKPHWGARGAAGILPFTFHEGRPLVLVGQRGRRLSEAGTWGGFGGAREKGEGYWDAARRELWEEVRVKVTGWRDSAAWECPACGWRYVTYLAEVPSGTKAKRPKETAWETADLRWVPTDEVTGLDLHPGFQGLWPQFRAEIDRALAERRENVA